MKIPADYQPPLRLHDAPPDTPVAPALKGGPPKEAALSYGNPASHPYSAAAERLHGAIGGLLLPPPAHPDPGSANSDARAAKEWLQHYRQPPPQEDGETRSCPFCRMPYPSSVDKFADATCTRCGSPLYVPEKLSTDQDRRRRAQRLVHHGEIRFFVGWPHTAAHTGEIRNVSPNGMQFHARVPLQEERIIRITSDFLTAVACVTHATSQPLGATWGYVVGVEFRTVQYANAKGRFFSART